MTQVSMGLGVQRWAPLDIIGRASFTLFQILGLAVVEEVMQALLCITFTS